MASSILVLVLTACGHSAEEADATPDAFVPPPTIVERDVVPQPPPPPPPTTVTRTRAWAVFVDDELDACIEHTRRYEIPAATEWSPPPIEDLAPLPEGRVIELEDGCAASFEGRTVLATCEGTTDAASALAAIPDEVTLLETYATQSFRFATALASDTRLEACLAAHRHWSAVADDSVEYARARNQARERRRVAPVR